MGTQIGNKNLEVSNTDEAESEFFRIKRDSNSDSQSRRQERWPQDRHHGPMKLIKKPLLQKYHRKVKDQFIENESLHV